MSATGIFFGVIVAGLLAFIIIVPLLVPKGEAKKKRIKMQDAAYHRVEDLELKLQLLLDSIRDLDFDYDMGKISAEVYVEQRKMLIGRGISRLMQLDSARQELDVLDHEIEEAVAARRQSYQPPAEDDELEGVIMAQRQKA